MPERYARYDRLKFDLPSERVLRVTFDRPEVLNAVDAQTHAQLTELWIEIDRDPDINAVIVTGAGGAFSAGGDFAMIEGMIGDPHAVMTTWKEARNLVHNIINCNKPIVSAINGPAAGAGLVVALLADIPVAGKKARLVDGHPRLGVAAGDVAAIIWPLLTSMAKAKYHLLTGRPVSGEEAERIGLVSLCVEDEVLQQTALEIAGELARGSQSAIRWTKYSLNNWMRQAGPIFDASTAFEMLGFMGEDVKEGLRAHREKRAPDFRRDCPL